MLVVTRVEQYMVTLKHNGRGKPLELPRQYFPDEIKVNDVVKIIKDECNTKRRKEV